MVAEDVTKGLSPDFLPVHYDHHHDHQQQDNNNNNNNSDGDDGFPQQRTIVIAYDHSENSDATFAKGIRLGLISPKDQIHIVHIIDQEDYRQMFLPAFTSSGYSVSGTTSDFSSYSNNDYSTLWDSMNDEFMTGLKNLLHKNGFENVVTETIRGDPKESMVDYCKSCHPNFLICSSRGLGTIKKTILGSVSDYYVKNIPIPVMVVKLTDQELEERKHHYNAKTARFKEIIDAFNERR